MLKFSSFLLYTIKSLSLYAFPHFHSLTYKEYALLSNLAKATNSPSLASRIAAINQHVPTCYFDKKDLYNPLVPVPPLDFSPLTAEFDFPTFSDFTATSRDGKPIHLHKSILSLKSQYWSDLLRIGNFSPRNFTEISRNKQRRSWRILRCSQSCLQSTLWHKTSCQWCSPA